MHARLIAVGRRMPDWIAAGFSEYAKRLSHALPLELVEIAACSRGKGRDPARAMAAESDAVCATIGRDAHVIALDEHGKPWSSQDLAGELANWRMQGRDLAFVIGGADGHAPEVLSMAVQRWSLGPLTLPHMLVRVIVAEQLYRASSLLAGHPYHRA